MSNLKYLYHFSNPALDIIEVKRLDREGAPLSEIYKWLVIMKTSPIVWELDFKSMDEGKRDFIQGSLNFDDEKASFEIFGKMFSLINNNPNELSADLQVTIENYLSAPLFDLQDYTTRFLKPSDLTYFNEWIFDKEVIQYSMTKFHRIQNLQQVSVWFESTLGDSKSFQVGLVDRKSNQLIGYAGIAGLNEVDGNGEYFIFIGNKSFWNKGLASIITPKIVEYGFNHLNLHRIFLTASSKNAHALKAYAKAGFKPEGVMREAFFRQNEYSDKIIMGTLKTEYVTN